MSQTAAIAAIPAAEQPYAGGSSFSRPAAKCEIGRGVDRIDGVVSGSHRRLDSPHTIEATSPINHHKRFLRGQRPLGIDVIEVAHVWMLRLIRPISLVSPPRQDAEFRL